MGDGVEPSSTHVLFDHCAIQAPSESQNHIKSSGKEGDAGIGGETGLGEGGQSSQQDSQEHKDVHGITASSEHVTCFDKLHITPGKAGT